MIEFGQRRARRACERYVRRFAEGTPAREAAMMILDEDKKATPAWGKLRKALPRREGEKVGQASRREGN